MISRPNINLESVLAFYTRAFSLILIAFSIMVMVAWFFDIEQIKIILPISALGFLCGGGALWFLQRKNIPTWGLRIGRTLAVLTLLIGLIHTSKYIVDWSLGVDLFLFRTDLAPMALITAVCFILWGVALLLIKSAFSHFFSVAIIILSMLAIVGFLVDQQSLYQLAGYDSVTLPSAIFFVIMALATLAAKPQIGIMKIAASRELGGRALRLFLPLTVLVVVLLGWLIVQGVQTGFFDTNNGITVLVMLVILFYSPLLFLYADRMNKAEVELNKFRFHDALTGLFNQSYFQEEISRLERGREFPVSILVADVDDMKIINDKYGRALGDLLLIQIGQTFASAFRANDVIARIGADEFAVLLPATDRETAESMMRRVRQLIAERNKANPIVQTTLSLGMSTAQNALFLAGALKAAGENLHQNRSKTIPHGKKTIPTV